MNAVIAQRILDEELGLFEKLTYEELRTLVGTEPRTREVTGEDAKCYQVESEVFWDGPKDGVIRVMCCVDDGSFFVLEPKTGCILKKKEPIQASETTRGM